MVLIYKLNEVLEDSVSEERGAKHPLLGYAFTPPALDPEDAMELFEIARLFHDNRVSEAILRFHQMVPEQQKRKIVFHLKKLGIDSGNPLENTFKTVQALFATGFQNAHYPSSRELKKWFADVADCMKQEEQIQFI
jgi:hypothetical protein